MYNKLDYKDKINDAKRKLKNVKLLIIKQVHLKESK